MMRRSASRRRAFTLMELILALTIGMLLLVGLYLALDVHLMATNAGREQVEQATVARQVLKRISNDITNNLALVPVPPNATSTSSKNSSTANTTGAMTTTTVTPTHYVFNVGVQGTSDRLTLYVSKVPGCAVPSATGDQPQDSDLRRISYWLARGHHTPAGPPPPPPPR